MTDRADVGPANDGNVSIAAVHSVNVDEWLASFGRSSGRRAASGRLRRRHGRLGATWHLDEVFVTIQGRQQYLWRAVDEDGDVLDILVQPRRNRHAAVRFFRRLLKNQRHVPRRLITDKLRSYSAACRAVMPSVLHCTDQYANNRAEGIVKLRLTAVSDAQHGGFATGWSPVYWGSIDDLFVNLTMPSWHASAP